MNKATIQELYSQSLEHLDLTFLDSDLIELLKTNDEFKQKVIDLLTFIIDSEDNNYVSVKNQDRLLAAFKSITSSEFLANNKLNTSKQEQIEKIFSAVDSILKQKFNKDFKTIKLEFDQSHQDAIQKVDSEVVKEDNNTPATNESKQQTSSTATDSDFDPSQFLSFSAERLAETAIQQGARMMLNNNIRNGSVYIYKTKPKINFILKIIIAVLFSLISLLKLAADIIVIFAQKNVYLIGKDGTSRNDALINIVPTAFILVLTILCVASIIYMLFRSTKNENIKYTIPRITLVIGIVIISIIIFTSSTFFSVFANYTQILKNVDTAMSAKGIKTLEAFRIVIYVLLAFYGILIALIIGSFFANPKQDTERLSLLTAQYQQDIKEGKVPFDFGNAGSPIGL